MKNYTFWIPIQGRGNNFAQAWQDAMEAFQEAAFQGEYDLPPADIFEEDDPVPAAEILGGSLSNGFGICEGEEDLGDG